METKTPDGFVVLHVAEDGSYSLRIWGCEKIHVLQIEEACPGDRVYELTNREEDPEELRALIGPDPIGHAGDGKLDDQTVQAIRAKLWGMEGKKLSVAEPPQ